MSTHSRIGIVRQVGSASKVESIYCHFDGYLTQVGEKLLTHWSDLDKLNELIALGDLSCLGTVIGEKHDFDTHVNSEAYASGWCLAYDRDRGETDVRSILHDHTDWPDYSQSYEYLFTPWKGWFYRTTYPGAGEFQPLTPEAIQAERAEEEAYLAGQAT